MIEQDSDAYMKPSAFLIGLMAGTATALLFAALILQSGNMIALASAGVLVQLAITLGLALATPVPIFIASLSWGSLAGFIAAGAATLSIAALTSSIGNGLVLLVYMGLPAAIIGHLAGLARPAEEASPPALQAAAPGLDWYPLDRILFASALAASLSCLVIGVILGFDPQEAGPATVEVLNRQMGAEVDPATAEQMRALTLVIIRAIPFVQPAFLMAILIAGLYAGAAVARRSGRLPRPRDDIPAKASLPKIALPLFALATAGSLLSGTVGTVSAVFAGTLGFAFTLVGLASLHRRSRQRSGRGFLLVATYTAILFLWFPLVAATTLGVFETLRRTGKMPVIR